MSKVEAISVAQEELATLQSQQSQHTYLTSIRGVLVLQSFLWIFFKTFIPAIVPQGPDGPTYQLVIRDVLGIFWNESLIYNAFILLSMRTIAVSFLENPTGQVYAATVIKRIIRMVVILCAASGISTLIFSQLDANAVSMDEPIKPYSALAVFNSLFNLFWLTNDFYTQAANNFWPTHTLWVPAIIYFQSWTVYFLMVFLPFTRPKWHLQGLALFALGSFWMNSWGWYSATGLFFADLAINPTLNESFKRGLWQVPYWTIGLASTVAGLALKYTFTALTQYVDGELILHPYLDLSESTSVTMAATTPYARVDDWLVVVGMFILLESFNVEPIKVLTALGDRAFSVFTAQSIIFYAAGIRLWHALDVSPAAANTVVFVTCLLVTAAFAELFYQAIDLPSRSLARNTYTWLLD